MRRRYFPVEPPDVVSALSTIASSRGQAAPTGQRPKGPQEAPNQEEAAAILEAD